MNVTCVVRVYAGWSPECHEHQPETVESGQEGREEPEDGQDLTEWSCRPSGDQQLVLAEKSRCQRKAGQRERADEERPIGDRQSVLEAAHPSHVLLMVQSDDHRAAAQEQQSLERSMR